MEEVGRPPGFKTEVIHAHGPWRSSEAMEYATLQWVDWFNHRRLLEPIGLVPPAAMMSRPKRRLHRADHVLPVGRLWLS